MNPAQFLGEVLLGIAQAGFLTAIFSGNNYYGAGKSIFGYPDFGSRYSSLFLGLDDLNPNIITVNFADGTYKTNVPDVICNDTYTKKCFSIQKINVLEPDQRLHEQATKPDYYYSHYKGTRVRDLDKVDGKVEKKTNLTHISFCEGLNKCQSLVVLLPMEHRDNSFFFYKEHINFEHTFTFGRYHSKPFYDYVKKILEGEISNHALQRNFDLGYLSPVLSFVTKNTMKFFSEFFQQTKRISSLLSLNDHKIFNFTTNLEAEMLSATRPIIRAVFKEYVVRPDEFTFLVNHKNKNSLDLRNCVPFGEGFQMKCETDKGKDGRCATEMLIDGQLLAKCTTGEPVRILFDPFMKRLSGVELWNNKKKTHVHDIINIDKKRHNSIIYHDENGIHLHQNLKNGQLTCYKNNSESDCQQNTGKWINVGSFSYLKTGPQSSVIFKNSDYKEQSLSVSYSKKIDDVNLRNHAFVNEIDLKLKGLKVEDQHVYTLNDNPEFVFTEEEHNAKVVVDADNEHKLRVQMYSLNDTIAEKCKVIEIRTECKFLEITKDTYQHGLKYVVRYASDSDYSEKMLTFYQPNTTLASFFTYTKMRIYDKLTI